MEALPLLQFLHPLSENDRGLIPLEIPRPSSESDGGNTSLAIHRLSENDGGLPVLSIPPLSEYDRGVTAVAIPSPLE